MAASYPTSVAVFTTKQNVVDIIDASHPNSVQDEVVAIEAALGINPNLSTTPSPSGTFVASSTSFASVSARIANIETGVVADSHTQYIRKTSDTSNTITPAAAANKGLVIRAIPGQTANLQEWQNSSGTVVTAISSTGSLTGVVSQTNGTVTTADTSSGVVRNIYSSTSAPTGGMDGDVWLRYT